MQWNPGIPTENMGTFVEIDIAEAGDYSIAYSSPEGIVFAVMDDAGQLIQHRGI